MRLRKAFEKAVSGAEIEDFRFKDFRHTAKVQYEDVLGGYKMGADYYITKPFTSTQLMTGINLFLSGDQGQSAGSP